jgi:hypothetical protein
MAVIDLKNFPRHNYIDALQRAIRPDRRFFAVEVSGRDDIMPLRKKPAGERAGFKITWLIWPSARTLSQTSD